MLADSKLMQVFRPGNIAELYNAVAELMETARLEGHPAETVYLRNLEFIALEDETLSDGSHVLNIIVRE